MGNRQKFNISFTCAFDVTSTFCMLYFHSPLLRSESKKKFSHMRFLFSHEVGKYRKPKFQKKLMNAQGGYEFGKFLE